MGFLSPWFLAGLLAVGLPVYLHLLRQHRNTPVMWSSLMFFEKRTQSSVKHRRLKYLMLLALRVALLALLVFAFANPFIREKAAAGDGRKRLLLVIDESFSMKAGNRLAEAKRQAAEVLARNKGSEKAQVAAMGFQLRMLTEPTDNVGELRAAIESVKGSDSFASFGEFTRAVRGLAASSPQGYELHLFSDMQNSAMPAGFADLQMPGKVKLVTHAVAAKTEANWTVETVTAPSAVADPKKARVQATIAGYGTPEATRNASLVVNGKTVASKPLKVAANGRATVEFQGLDVPYGFSRCEVRIDGADSFAADDTALFAVERSDPRRVLFVHEGKDARSPLYFQSALGSAAESAFVLESVVTEQTANLDPARFAFVVLSDTGPLPAAFEDRLKKWVRTGGSVWLAAGAAMGRNARLPVMDAVVAESKYYSRAGERFAAIGQTDGTHPSIRRSGKWEGVKFYYAVRVEPGDARIVARLTDQTPLVLDKKVGEGRVLFFGSTFDNIANDFPLVPGFVPFVEQSARYLAGIEDRAAARVVNSFIELRSAKEQSLSIELIDPDGARPLSLREATTAETFQAPRAGFYEVRRANGRHDMVAMNPDRRESDLSVVPAETLALWSGDGAVQTAGGPSGMDAEQDQQRRLWWYVMLLAMAVALAESVFASRYLGVQREE
ncbi:MAG: BatA and WFA domain-containing protein [Bryobacterales bacterium]|nr:BatA and WFA domain-containing protein [Bryobacterales bacterium]